MIDAPPEVISVDVDLRRIHAWSSVNGMVCYKEPDFDEFRRYLEGRHSHHYLVPPTILLEIASAMSYEDGDARKLYQKRRWMIFNGIAAGVLGVWFAGSMPGTLLVSPSSAWTRGYPEKIRQAMAKADAKNHDLRECQTMLAFYAMHPKAWVPFAQFVNEDL